MDFGIIANAMNKAAEEEAKRRLKIAMPGIANAIEAGIARNFQKQGAWSGSGDIGLLSGGNAKWKELSPITKALYRKKGWKQEPTLSRTGGGLASSIEIRPNASGLGITISANKEYAAIHQFGGQTGRNLTVTIPARPFLIINADTLDEIQDEIIAAR